MIESFKKCGQVVSPLRGLISLRNDAFRELSLTAKLYCRGAAWPMIQIKFWRHYYVLTFARHADGRKKGEGGPCDLFYPWCF